jgi:anaerobic selenocysteine-containing dehydrogenase
MAADLLAPGLPGIEVLLLDEVNPVFASPKSWRIREALERIPYIVSFGSFIDETSVLADLILPDHSFLESWAEGLPESGSLVTVANAAPPSMKPLHQTRATADLLLDVSRRLKAPLAPPLPWQTFEEMLAQSFASLPSAADGTDAWTTAKKQGGWWGDVPATRAQPAPRSDGRGEARASRTVTFEAPRFDGDAAQFPFHFLPYPSQAFLDGRLAHLPWLQEMPDPLTSAMWSSWVELNPATAERLDVHLGDIVEVSSSAGSLRAPAVISPGLAPDVIAMPVGQGHAQFTRIATGRGVNPVSILAGVTEAETGQLAWAATRVQVARVGDPDGRLIQFAGEMREHPFEGYR